MSKLRIAPRSTPPQPDSPELLNTSLCVDVESYQTLPGAIMQTAKLARLLNLAMMGLIHYEQGTGSQEGDLQLLQELAFGIDAHASQTERQYVSEHDLPKDWRQRIGHPAAATQEAK